MRAKIKKPLSTVLFCLIISIVTLLIYASITEGHGWGDDFASYIMQAKSLLKGETLKFFNTNQFIVQQSPGTIGPTTYPWGTAILLSPVVAIFGLNIVALKSLNIVCRI